MKLRPIQRIAVKSAAMALSALLAMTAIPMSAQAGLKEAMNQLFVNTSTDPQVINTQRLKGVYGGSMTLRPLSAGINIVQFAPPKIDAGCGGVDIFFGSFSFINGAQFEQLIRSIAANAVGFAIKAAIDGMCSPCGKLLAELEAAMRELNSMMKNTCAIGSAIGTADKQKLSEMAGRIGSSLSAAASSASDTLKAENWRFSFSPNEVAKGEQSGSSSGSSSGNSVVAENNPLDGNVVFLAAKESMAKGGNTLKAFLSEKDVIGLIMGLYGTVIYNPSKEAGDKCPTGVGAERCTKLSEDIAPTITKFAGLMHPASFYRDGVPIVSCASADCRKTNTTTIPLTAWGGVSEIVSLALFGLREYDGYSGAVSPDSIVGSFVHKNGQGQLSSAAKSLVATVPMPILNMMQEIQDIPGAVSLLGMQLMDILPEYYAYHIAMELQTIGANAFGGQTGKDMPAAYEGNLKQKSEELNFMRPKTGALLKIFSESTNSIIMIRNLTKSQYRSDSKKN